MNAFRIELLPNGFWRVYCRASGLVALYNYDGTNRNGGFAAHDAAIRLHLAALPRV